MRKLNPNLVAFVDLLQDQKWHDGPSVGQSLQMTRTAVWKMVEKLRSYGVAIEANKSRGYRLSQPLTLLNRKRILADLPESLRAQVDMVIFETIDSTNAYLKKSVVGSFPFVLAMAELQTQGRGRFERPWHASFATDLLLSLRYNFDRDIAQLISLSRAVSEATIRALSTYGLSSLVLKAPNDVMAAGAKLSGCLIEVLAEVHGQSTAIIGIGVNCNKVHKAGHDPIDQPWTSVHELAGSYCDRNRVASLLLREVMMTLINFSPSSQC